MQLDFRRRELTIKLVYYGPALSGKTTNLQALHDLVDPKRAGRLMTLETKDDRTLFFDMLPISVATSSGLKIRVKLFTVPGQVIHSSTRRLVLQGADGVAFVADSRISETKANQEAFRDMYGNLKDNGFDPKQVPLVIQFNKRDLPDIRSDEEIDTLQKRGKEPVFKAVALRGVGVLETLLGLLQLSWEQLEETHELSGKFSFDSREVLQELRSSLAGNTQAEEAAGG